MLEQKLVQILNRCSSSIDVQVRILKIREKSVQPLE